VATSLAAVALDLLSFKFDAHPTPLEARSEATWSAHLRKGDPAMSIRLSVLAVLTVVLTSALLVCPTARADKAKEAGPEDGILCCNGLVRFLFDDDKVMTVTGRAGVFRSDDRGGHWRRSMDGLVAANGVAPFVGFVCNSPSISSKDGAST
jgi:hypothetical protein